MDNQQAWELLLETTPNGTQTLSKQPSRFTSVYPKVLTHGRGGHVWDMDGNEYIDFISGLGAVSLGYSHPYVNQAVVRQVYRGTSFSLPTLLEALVSLQLRNLLPHTDMWKYGKNGTDGTVMAVRCARAYTERDKVLSVGYNGCADVFEVCNTRNAGIPKDLAKHITKATYNDLESFKELYTKQYACVIMEPMAYEYPKKGFLEFVRYMCSETGTVLIFDEVVCGGRFEGMAAQNHFKVYPDLTVLSKGIANGFPLSALGGKRAIMEVFERDNFFASSTFGGETVSLAACMATLDVLEKKVSSMVEKGTQIQNHFNRVFEGLAKTEGYPTRFKFTFPTEFHRSVFMQEMCLQGILIGSCVFIMADHTEEDIQKVFDAIEEAYVRMEPHWEEIEGLLIGKPSEPVFKVR